IVVSSDVILVSSDVILVSSDVILVSSDVVLVLEQERIGSGGKKAATKGVHGCCRQHLWLWRRWIGAGWRGRRGRGCSGCFLLAAETLAELSSGSFQFRATKPAFGNGVNIKCGRVSLVSRASHGIVQLLFQLVNGEFDRCQILE